ncbi:hypothetical protein Lalb_Chr20g0109891 [Lupinus albus]|uniref:Uncharacterized protein n=1 Tax=Lupinus albus TaxID=3870 RepID=A0A6A4NVV6_LUPAL|nr:hypothetical protein Lalb_Chr20g0109891 [Lupinus albus]
MAASKFLLFTVFVLDLIAFGLAVAAERRRNIVSIIITSLYSKFKYMGITLPLSFSLCAYLCFFA